METFYCTWQKVQETGAAPRALKTNKWELCQTKLHKSPFHFRKTEVVGNWADVEEFFHDDQTNKKNNQFWISAIFTSSGGTALKTRNSFRNHCRWKTALRSEKWKLALENMDAASSELTRTVTADDLDHGGELMSSSHIWKGNIHAQRYKQVALIQKRFFSEGQS